jgi:hypothetical protein
MRKWTALAVLLAAGTFAGFGPTGTAGAAPVQSELRGYGMALYEGQARPTNAAPADTSILRSGVGRYRVVFPRAAARHGVVHVAAVNPGPVWCQVMAFGPFGADELVSVGCFRAGGTPADTNFSISFNGHDSATPPPAPELGKFGYLDARADGTILTAYNSTGRTNTVTPSGAGTYRVSLPGLGAAGGRRGGLMVTAIAPASPARCKVGGWTTSTAGQDALVVCHDAAGARTNTRFTLTFHDQPTWGETFPWAQYGYVWRQGLTGSDPTNFNSVLGEGGNRSLNGPDGQVAVELPHLTTRPDTVQLAAFGTSADFCAIGQKWYVAGIVTFVPGIRCYTAAGARSQPAFLLWYGNNPA